MRDADLSRSANVPPVIAFAMADRQVFQVAVAALAQGAHVFQRRILWHYMKTADPTGHLAMQLAGHGVINFGTCQG